MVLCLDEPSRQPLTTGVIALGLVRARRTIEILVLSRPWTFARVWPEAALPLELDVVARSILASAAPAFE